MSFSDILALAASIQELTRASRRARTAMWCALMVTIHFDVNPELATAQVFPNVEKDNSAQICTVTDSPKVTEGKNAISVDGEAAPCVENTLISTVSKGQDVAQV